MEQLGLGFVTYKPKLPYERHVEAARAAWAQAEAEMASGAQDVLILDEINNAFRFGLIEAGPVVEALRARPAELTVVLTGRGAPPEILEAADLVTEMTSRKHPYQQGLPALYGIDF
jgi:cob(I)alamin adenosyltransferase